MKTKTITILLALFCALISYAQQIEFMGLPLHSHINDYCKVLKEHRFSATYESSFWENGDFWKQRNCYVHTFKSKDDYVNLVEVTIPFKNFKSIDDYRQTITDLLNDFYYKYGNCSTSIYEMEKHNHTDFFYAHDHGGNKFYVYTWNLSNGTIEVLYNADRQWSILIQYTTIERMRTKQNF